MRYPFPDIIANAAQDIMQYIEAEPVHLGSLRTTIGALFQDDDLKLLQRQIRNRIAVAIQATIEQTVKEAK